MNKKKNNIQSKRIVYIWPENLEFWLSLDNKSEIVNKHLANLKAELPGQTDISTSLQDKLRAIDANFQRTDADGSAT